MARIHSLEPIQADSKVQELPAVAKKAIEEVVGKYIEGGRAADSSIMKLAFHENAQMSGPAEDGAFSGNVVDDRGHTAAERDQGERTRRPLSEFVFSGTWGRSAALG